MQHIEVNEYLTPITEELISLYPDEVVELFFDCVLNIEFILNLISPYRKRAKDLPRDSEGKIIIDLENPHIVEDMDYFRLAAIHYLEHDCYTLLKPNNNPYSEYCKFWKEERRRCLEGYIRESDGEWVPGMLYWYLNYNPMLVNIYKKGSKEAIRKESMPFFFEGCYWRFHYLYLARKKGLHGIELAKRGASKSYSLAAIMTHNLVLGENPESTRRTITVLTAYQKEFLKADKDGTLSKFEPSLNFIRSHTEFPRLMLKNSPNEMSWLMGYIDEFGIKKGSLNQALAVSAKDDSGKLRGKRGWILFEEMGLFKNLLSLYDVTRKSVEDGNYTFAMMYLVGTASDSESDFSSAKTLLYSPAGYNIYAMKNVFDKPKQGRPTFGFFFPSYINRAGCYNKDGVSDVTKALLEILMARYIAKYNSADPASVLRVIAEDPITPAEAIIKVKNAYFPLLSLNERLLQIDSDPKELDSIYVGDLVQKGTEIEFVPSSDVPIRLFGKEPESSGAIEIIAMPEKNKEGKVYNNRYIIGHDPVDNDLAESSSLSSTIVFDLFTDSIVAEFTGRKAFAEDNYEIVRKLCLFYNAKCLYESNKKGLFAYFSKMLSIHLLALTPEYLRDKGLVKYSAFGSNAYGVNAIGAINNFANEMIRDWLLKPYEHYDAESDTTILIPLLFKIKNRALLEELIAFNPEINVDRIRALGMVMLYREEKVIMYNGNVRNLEDSLLGSTELANDKFFNRNYSKKKY